MVGRRAAAVACSIGRRSRSPPREFRVRVVTFRARSFSRFSTFETLKSIPKPKPRIIRAQESDGWLRIRPGLKMKRLASDDRTARILSDRLRTIGVDKHALDEQVVEKQQRMEREARERHQADAAWSAAWLAVEENHARRQAAYQERMVAYRAELHAQIDAKRIASGRDKDMIGGAGFMDGFQKSHR